MCLSLFHSCFLKMKRKCAKWTGRQRHVNWPSACSSPPPRTILPPPPPAPTYRKTPVQYNSFMAAIAFPPKQDNADREETREEFRNTGQNSGDSIVQGKEWWNDRSGWFDYTPHMRGGQLEGTGIHASPFPRTQTPVGSRIPHRPDTRPSSITRTLPIQGSFSIPQTPNGSDTPPGRGFVTGQGRQRPPPVRGYQ